LCLDDWRCDQCRWRQNGHKEIVNKYYFIAATTNGTSKDFQKIVFYLPENPDLYLIQYIGNEIVAADYPHGNAPTETTRPHIWTCPSVSKQIKISNPARYPSTFYKNAVSTSQCHSTLSPVLNPHYAFGHFR